MRGETQTAYELAERLLSLAKGVQDTDLLLQAHLALGNTLYYRGEPLPARTHLEQAIALYQPQRYRSHLFRYAVDPGTTCLRNLAWTLWLLGYPDQALEKSQAALRLAQESMHPPSLVAGLVYGARVHQYRREAHLTQQLTEAAMTLAREHGFTQRLAAATILHGWALAVQDQIDAGLAEMRQGLDAFRATGAEDDRPYWLALLAEGYGQGGQVSAGLQALTEALTVAQSRGLRVWEAELYRLQGALLKQASESHTRQAGGSGPQAAVGSEMHSCLRQSLKIARRQHAKIAGATSGARPEPAVAMPR